MQIQNEHHSFTGMQRDMNPSKHPTSFLYDAKNIRLTPREGDTMFAITNEKGTLDTGIKLYGNYLGHCLLNKYLVVFTKKDTNNIIYRIDLDTQKYKELYNDNLEIDNPIQTIGSFESSNIQKVYWTDGKNQPRVINITDDLLYGELPNYNKNSFNFVPNLQLNEEVRVSKIPGMGEFPSGVIQYAFTYFNKYKQESNIFYTTPLQYISYIGRAGSPEEKISNAFKISLSGLDIDNFEFLRIYSILRTSLNSTPVVKRVQDIKLLENRTILDVSKESNWYYQFLGGTSDIEISLDNGFSFTKDLSPFEVDPNREVPYMNSEGNSNKEEEIPWEANIINKEGTAYKFSKDSYPNLIIKLGNLYYTWGDSEIKYIYIGISGTTNYKVFAGENSAKGISNIIQSNSLSEEDIVVGVEFIDDGTQGDIIDPTELLYKGNDIIKATTLTQKDNTLFLGGISLLREPINIKDSILNYTEITKENCIANSKVEPILTTREYLLGSKEPIPYIDTLTSAQDKNYAGASFFKSNEYYRLGVQFQHESGKWSEPYWIGDKQNTKIPEFNEGTGSIKTPEFKFTLDDSTILQKLDEGGYKKARGVFAVPNNNDRTILCQGVICPTLYRKVDRYIDSKEGEQGIWGGSEIGTLYAQSSWVFRPFTTTYINDQGGNGVQPNGRLWSYFDFKKDDNGPFPNLFSTEVMGVYNDGNAFYSDPYFITFHSPDVAIDSSFQHIDFTGCSLYSVGDVELLNTYGDISIQTSSPPIGSSAEGFIHKSIKTTGDTSLISGYFYKDYVVDDVDSTPKYKGLALNSKPISWPVFMWHKSGSLNNDVNRSGRSSELLKKKISNYRFGNTTTYNKLPINLNAEGITIFKDDHLSMIKVNGYPYRGNIETMITPSYSSPFFLGGAPGNDIDVEYTSGLSGLMLSSFNPDDDTSTGGMYTYNTKDKKWVQVSLTYPTIGEHVPELRSWREGISIKYKSTPHLVAKISSSYDWMTNTEGKLLLAEIRRPYNKYTLFGGYSEDALKNAIWIPCGPPVKLNTSSVSIHFKWGDTYMQRFECLKTYPFTQEDKNQVVEIASFMCETRINIDGRYDRNRAQSSNLNVSPTNFNLINNVYSQLDNFFSYRILEDDYYKLNDFPNQITWSKEKQPGSEIDLYTNITLASTHDLDGSKGKITSLNIWNDTIYCFQNKGISNILFNSRVQIPTSDNVPIEITNSYKVDGHRYISDSMGCDSQAKIKETPSGIYFIDSISNKLFNLGSNISDITTTKNMYSWFNNNTIKKLMYDHINSDLYISTEDTTLCFSEVLGQFTSFMDYNNIDLMESYGNTTYSVNNQQLYKMFEGAYNVFFDEIKPWDFTFISNGIDSSVTSFDKIFSNINYSSENYDHEKSLDFIRVENEYQDTNTISLLNGSSLKKKFKIWRIQIPRDKTHKMDRIRSPWCKITLGCNGDDNAQTTLYDLNVQYYM